MRHVLFRQFAREVTKLGRGIFDSMRARDQRPTRMPVFPLGKVINLAAINDPAIFEKDRGAATVDRAVRTLCVAAIEINAQ